MNTNEKIAVEQHLLKVCGFNPASREYKLIQLLFNNDELDFISTNRDDAVELRKELWFLKFECRMQWNKVILTDDAIVKYYENVMGLIAQKTQLAFELSEKIKEMESISFHNTDSFFYIVEAIKHACKNGN